MSESPATGGTTHFAELTEATGTPVTREGACMLYTRYAVAAAAAPGARVLEIGCGSGQGLGLIAGRAEHVVGADIDLGLLRAARTNYGARVSLVCLRADFLAFAGAAFDLVVFFEASYYVANLNATFDEIVRVLRPGGTVLIVNANPDRPDFIPSPHSHRYHSAGDLRRELEARGCMVTAEGACRLESVGLANRLARLTRNALVRLRLVPKTLRARARLKRLVYGPPIAVPAELEEGFAERASLHPLTAENSSQFKVIYVTGVRQTGSSHGPAGADQRLSGA